MKQNIVYMLKCSNNSYYTGWTNDFYKRMKAHQQGTASHYTHAFIPKEVVLIKCFETKSEAMKQESQIKKLTRKQKDELIQTNHEQTSAFLALHPYQFKGE